jgi:diphthamide synthase (EF-2-diphthine--ammonia ligase)
MLYKEFIAVCSQIHTKHTNPLFGQNHWALMVHIVTKGL